VSTATACTRRAGHHGGVATSGCADTDAVAHEYAAGARRDGSVARVHIDQSIPLIVGPQQMTMLGDVFS
jgi:hypothetical protein